MRILANIGGAQHGLYTAGGGEVRWIHNLVMMLSGRGHDITAWGTGHRGQEPPQWGYQTPLPDVKFSHYRDLNTTPNFYDIHLGAPWDWHDLRSQVQQCKGFPLQTNKTVHLQFSWNDQMEESTAKNYQCIREPWSHLVAVPYAPLSQYSYTQTRPYLLPIPYMAEIVAPVPSEHLGFVWACKDVFSDEWREDMPIHEEGAKILQIMSGLSQRYKFHSYFVSAWCFNTQRARRFGIPQIINSFYGATLHPRTIPYDKILGYFRRARLSVSLPGYFAGCWDASASGAITLGYRESNQVILTFGPDPSLYNGIPSADAQNIIESFWADDELYLKTVEAQRQKMLIHSYDSSYKCFLDMVKET